MKQHARAAFVLANESIGNVQDDVVADSGQRIDFRDGYGQAVRVILKAKGVVYAAKGEAVEMPAHAGRRLVE